MKRQGLKPHDMNPGVRSGFERRRYDYAVYVPERRSGKDRREATADPGRGASLPSHDDGRRKV